MLDALNGDGALLGELSVVFLRDCNGLLAEGHTWVQQSITGSEFSLRYRWEDEATGTIVPTVTGTAMITGEARLFLHAEECSEVGGGQ